MKSDVFDLYISFKDGKEAIVKDVSEFGLNERYAYYIKDGFKTFLNFTEVKVLGRKKDWF